MFLKHACGPADHGRQITSALAAVHESGLPKLWHHNRTLKGRRGEAAFQPTVRINPQKAGAENHDRQLSSLPHFPWLLMSSVVSRQHISEYEPLVFSPAYGERLSEH